MTTEENQYFNPSHEGLETEKFCDPSILIIFGASGNLTRAKLMPALFNLYKKGHIPEGSKIVGLSRSYKDHYHFRDEMKKAIKEFGSDEQKKSLDWDEFSKLLYYISADFGDEKSYEKLKDEIIKLESKVKRAVTGCFIWQHLPSFSIL